MDTTMEGAARRDAKWFYVWMAGVFVLIAFGGFVPTYWAKLAAGGFKGAPILHIHGMLFFSWTLLFLTQTVFVATGHTPNHRNWGMTGIALATAMGITVVLGAINSIKVASAIGMGDDARRFAIVSMSGVVLFWAFFALAIANLRNADLHKRLMLLANIPLMHAATARLFMTAFAPPDAKGPPPIFVAIPPGLTVDLLVVAAMVHDWRRRGRPHPAYMIGGTVLLAVQLLLVPVGKSDGWMAIAKWVESLAG
jgi:hypothetical protein